MSSAIFSPPPSPIFVGENYHLWVVKMKTYLQAYDLWEVVEMDRDPLALRANPTLAQMRQHSEECAKKHKVMSCIQNGVSDVIFTRIMACATPKQAWDKLKEEFMGTGKTRQQQLLNLRRDFENLKMKEIETVKQYSDKIMAIVNNIRLLGDEFSEKRIVEKVITTLSEKYESKISSLEDPRDLSSISFSELINALYAQEQRRASRQQEHSEAAFQAKGKERASSSNNKGKKNWIDRREKPRRNKDNAKDGEKKKYPPCSHCKKTTHLEKYCWYRPDIQCRSCKQLGHMEKVCKNKVQQQQNAQAQAADGNKSEDEQMFTTTCYATSCKTNENWLIDSGCTNHMASDESMFKNIDRTCISWIKIGNGQFIEAKGRGDVLVNTPTCTKIISDVLLVPDTDQNLLSVGQLLEKNYSIVFKNKSCLIFYPTGCELVSVAMNERSFVLDWNSLTSNAYSSIIDETNLWHKRLGHVNYSTLCHLYKSDLVLNLSKVIKHGEMCGVCQFGKQNRLSFPVNKAWRATDKLHLVHTDVYERGISRPSPGSRGGGGALTCPCEQKSEKDDSVDVPNGVCEGLVTWENPLFWNGEADRGVADEDVGLVHREVSSSEQLRELGFMETQRALPPVPGLQGTIGELLVTIFGEREQSQEVDLGAKSPDSLKPLENSYFELGCTEIVSNQQVVAHQDNSAVEIVLSKGLSRKVRSVNDLVIDTLSAEQRNRLLKAQGKGKRGRTRKDGGRGVSFANESLTDSDFVARQTALLKEAEATVQLGQLVGVETLGREEELIKDITRIISTRGLGV
ncbi:hypothetical protein GQ457_12G031630 [Hibiscus cannabinus]